MPDKRIDSPAHVAAGFQAGSYTTVIIRLLIDNQGTVLNGELTTLDGGRVSLFLGWKGMLRSLRTYLLKLSGEDERRRRPV